MDAEKLREFLLKLPHVEETMQWGENLVFWVGNKVIGGKMFALTNLDDDGNGVLAFHAGEERYNELLENEGVVPAPYMARIFWVSLERWDVLPERELKDLLVHAHGLVYGKMPKRVKEALALPQAQQRKLIAEKRKALAAKSKT